jgi:hypothetical protein
MASDIPLNRKRTEAGHAIRIMSNAGTLHSLVASNHAGAWGSCMANRATERGGRCWCVHDFGHDGPHWNRSEGVEWPNDSPDAWTEAERQEWERGVVEAKRLLRERVESVEAEFEACAERLDEAEAACRE